MTPSPNRRAIIMGLFVAVAVAILAIGILTIGDLNDTFTRKITVSAVFEGVNGLKRGDNVWYSGVKVGTVKKLGFHGDSEVEVELAVDTDATPYIHADALVKISSDGLIGSKIVVIYDGTPAAPALSEGDVLQVGDTVSGEEMMTMLQDNNANLLAITSDIKGITAGLAAGEGTLGKLLKDEALHAKLADTVSNLDDASTHARSLTASLSTFSAKLNQKGSLPHDLVTDQTTYASLAGTVDTLKHTGDRASDLVDGLAQGAADPGTPIGALMHDDQAGTDLKGTLGNLNRGSFLLAEDLEALQHNLFFRGFFLKRERAAAKARAAMNATDLRIEEAAPVETAP